ncbi:MAG: nucleotidyltransferase domain-containing protein [Oscillospiraceae bacterium]|jgi:predicted nucleotidyltransferase|nr:nucleotidyltransferase domain-containing protein [Oscillospiraceae bacterium]
MIHITDKHKDMVYEITSKYAPDCEVRAFGSRVKGTHRSYSDLDLLFVGERELGWSRVGDLREAFMESDIPFRVDVLDYHLTSPEFLAAIENTCEVLFPVQA